MVLDEKDYTVLSYLYHSYREPASKIAKATKLTRDQVEYRLRKYLNNEVKKFATIFNYSKLGYNSFALFLLDVQDQDSLKKIETFLQKSKNCISFGETYSRYDLYVNGIFKDQMDLKKFMEDIFHISEGKINNNLVISPFFAELYPLKIINGNERETFSIIEETHKEIKLDGKDKEIIMQLEIDGRMKLIDIATRVKLSSELTLYRMRKLRERGVIKGSRIAFDMEKMGYFFTVILIKMNLSEKNQSLIKKFASSEKNVDSLTLSVSHPNATIQFFHKDEKELRDSLERFKKKFGNEKMEFEIIPLGKDKKLDTLPFLK